MLPLLSGRDRFLTRFCYCHGFLPHSQTGGKTTRHKMKTTSTNVLNDWQPIPRRQPSVCRLSNLGSAAREGLHHASKMWFSFYATFAVLQLKEITRATHPPAAPGVVAILQRKWNDYTQPHNTTTTHHHQCDELIRKGKRCSKQGTHTHRPPIEV